MNVVYSFIGTMPNYVVTSIRQLRFFFDGPVYLIFDNLSKDIETQLSVLGVRLIPYESVKSERFEIRKRKLEFSTVPKLESRSQLFARSYERFYLLGNLMKNLSLENVWFMELDIMMYLNPNELLPMLGKYDMAYAYHRPSHCNSGIFFTRDLPSLEKLLTTMDNYLRKDGNFEMFALHEHYLSTAGIAMFPLCAPPSAEHPMFWKNHEDFGDLLFDGAILSILYFGFDPFHTGGVIKPQIHDIPNVEKRFLNIWKYGKMIWKKDSHDLQLPYFQTNDGREYRIANLHVHSKTLDATRSDRVI
jgi:hypothetical protein